MADTFITEAYLKEKVHEGHHFLQFFLAQGA